jgi:hypothetical protein
LYGAEKWTLTVPQKKRIEAAEMKLLQNIVELLDTYRTNWHNHLLRMEPYRVPLQVYHYRPTGRINVG